MTLLLEPPIIQTPEALVTIAFERLRESYPNFNPGPADPNYEYFLAFAYMVAEAMLLSIDVPEELIRIMGEIVYQTPLSGGTHAEGTTTWKAVDTAGHTIPAGTTVILEPEGGEPQAFEVVSEVSISPGGVTATGVQIKALEEGSEGNIEVSTKVQPVELLSWVEGITVTSLPAGGTDEEGIEEYSNRILELARLIKPQPILPEDFANFVRLLVPGLKGTRVLAVDLLEMTKNYPEGANISGVNEHPNNVEKANNIERCVTVIPILESGNEPTEAVCKEAWELLETRREATFRSFIGSPTYTTVAVKIVGTFLPGNTEAGVKEAVEAAVKNFLSPSNWGAPQNTSEVGWVQRKKLFYQDVVAVVGGVIGFGHYTELKVAGAEADVTLSGIAPLTKPGTITVALSEAAE